MTPRVTVDDSGFLLSGSPYPVLSGEVHYWRLDPAYWPAVLDAVAGLGFTTVSSYLPWSRHETAPGSFDFNTGSLNVARFIDLLAERDLKFIARPGPNAGAELEDSGWPRRVLDDPACQARRPDGRPYLLPTSVHQAFMPSYGSRSTLAEVSRWYDAVIPLLASYQWPAGPLIASHVDNECGYHFQGHAFALDYHPDTLEQWTEFLAERYSSADEIAIAYGFAADGFAYSPPRDGREEPELRRLDWVAFREHHLRRTLSALATMQRERGLDRIAMIHNDYPRKATPLDPGVLERSGAVDVAAGDIYASRHGGRYVRDYARYLCGSTRLPYLAEMGVGWLTLPWLLPMAIAPADIEHTVWQALAGGIRAANVFMLVERDRWYGSPVSPEGVLRQPLADFYRRLLALLGELDWPRLRRTPQVLLIDNRAEGRRSAARAVRGDLVPAFAQVLPLDRRIFDGADPAGAEIDRWRGGITAVLDAAGLDWDEATSSALPDLTNYRLVVLPVVDLADPGVLDLGRKASEAGTTLLFGPGRPCHDQDLRPLVGRLTGWTHLVDPGGLRTLLPAPAWSSSEPAVSLAPLAGAGREILVVVNNSERQVAVTLSAVGRYTLTGRWRNERLSGEGSVTMELPGWAVQVFEVFRD